MQTYHRLDDIQMSAIEREHAKAHMRSAELTIDFIVALVNRTRLIGTALARHAVSLMQHMQISRQQAAQQ